MWYRVISWSIIVTLVISVFSVACVSASPTLGTTYYIDVNHPQAEDSSNHGNIDKPWKTLIYAFQQLQPGDILLIRGGIYEYDSYTIFTTDQNSGQESAPITVKAYPGEEVVWRGGGSYLWHIATTRYWVIEGIIFENGLILGRNSDEIAEHIVIRNCQLRNSNVGFFIHDARHILIDNCSFVNARSGQPGLDLNALDITDRVDDITIRNCYFEDIGSDGVHLGAGGDDIGQIIIENNEFLISGQRSPVGENGIDVKGVQGPIVITGNSFHGFRQTVEGQDASGAQGEGIVIHLTREGGPAAKHVTVERNLFYNNTMHLVIAGGSDDIVVRNNIFRDAYGENDAPGIGVVAYDPTNVQILHNTFFNNKSHLRGALKVTSGTIKNNLFYQGGLFMPLDEDLLDWEVDYNAWGRITGDVPQPLLGSHDYWIDDPKLMSNLRPLLSSPLINAGQNVGVPDDFSGNLRSDTLPDLGAFEYAAYSFQVFLPLISQ